MNIIIALPFFILGVTVGLLVSDVWARYFCDDVTVINDRLQTVEEERNQLRDELDASLTDIERLEAVLASYNGRVDALLEVAFGLSARCRDLAKTQKNARELLHETEEAQRDGDPLA
jgi:chromosome segregation ATPase